MKSKRIYLILIILSLCWFGYINVKACEYTDEKMKPDSVSTGTELKVVGQRSFRGGLLLLS